MLSIYARLSRRFALKSLKKARVFVLVNKQVIVIVWPLLITGLLVSGCERTTSGSPVPPLADNKPTITNNGEVISFRQPPATFGVKPASRNSLSGTYVAPAVVAASILSPSRREASAIILFDDPELNQLYSGYQQSLAHYTRDTEFLERTRDMYQHQAATGRELREAETGVAEAATELAEKESRFRMLGFSPDEIRAAKPGYVWLLCDVPETILGELVKGEKLSISFSSYPAEVFTGQIEAIGDVIDNTTRTVKVRIALPNKDGRIKPGMYAKVNIVLNVKNTLAVPATALVAVQAKNYVFVKNDRSFLRREVITGQQIDDQVLVLKGLQENDSVVYQGAMLLKGLSFGY